MTYSLLPYQAQTVEYGVKNPYCILGLQMGLGKSFAALSIADRTNSKALIVCPSYLKLKWKSEIDKFFPGRTVSLFEKASDIYFPWDSDYAIISYNSLTNSEVLFEWADTVIFDEAHFLKEIRSKRSEAAHRLIFENSIKRCLLLTGTPIQNRVYEFYSLLAICNYNPQITNSPFLDKFPTYVDFANHFSYLKEFEIFRGGKRVKVSQWEGIRNEDELELIKKDIYIRFNSEDVLDLPPGEEIDVPVCWEDMPELLDEFENFKEDSPGTGSTAKAKAALLKAPHTIEYVKGMLEEGLQVVVYSDHVESCLAIAKGLGVVGITGMTKMSVRSEMANAFMRGESKVIVATIGSLSTGIDLFSSFNMVFNDIPWVPGWLEQAKFRIIRVGQKFKCFFHYIIGTPQDKVIMQRQKEKTEVIKRAT